MKYTQMNISSLILAIIYMNYIIKKKNQLEYKIDSIYLI